MLESFWVLLATCKGRVKHAVITAARRLASQSGRLWAVVLPHLMGALKDGDRSVRGSAAKAMGQLAGASREVVAKALPHLVRTLRDGEKHARRAASWSLGRIAGRPLVTQPLMSLLCAALKLGPVQADSLSLLTSWRRYCSTCLLPVSCLTPA